MRTVDYSAILATSAGLAGMKFPDDIGVAELALFSTFHDRRFQAAYEIEAWPDLCPTEKRYFRPVWNAATIYDTAAGDGSNPVERFDITSGMYFQSLQTANQGNAPTIAGAENSAFWAQCRTQYSGNDWAASTSYAVGVIVRNTSNNQFYQCISAHTSLSTFDVTKFGILVPFVRRIDFAQVEDSGAGPGLGTAHTVIGEYLSATDKDWRVTTKVNDLPYVLDERGAVFVQPQKAVTFAWLKFRMRRPSLSGNVFDASAVYTSGLQVYYLNAAQTVANFYVATTTTTAGDSPESAPSKWSVVPVPYIFGGYLKEAGYADWLYADGQDDKAGVHESNAQMALELEADKLWRQQGQNGRLNWRR